MTFVEYLKIDAVNWSALKEMRRSPLHYRHFLSSPPPDSDRLALGRATHTAVLEPDRFPLDYVVYEGRIRRGAEWEVFKEACAGRTILKPDHYLTCLAMRDAVRANPIAMKYLACGEPESVIEWVDVDTGLHCKGRPDWLCPLGVVDLKTTRSIDHRMFGATAARFGYHAQLAFYVDGSGAVTQGLPSPATIIAVEAEPPHDVGVFVLDPEESLYAGREEYRELLARVAECRAADKWPGRFDEEQSLLLPAWVFEGDEEDGIAGLKFSNEEATP